MRGSQLRGRGFIRVPGWHSAIFCSHNVSSSPEVPEKCLTLLWTKPLTLAQLKSAASIKRTFFNESPHGVLLFALPLHRNHHSVTIVWWNLSLFCECQKEPFDSVIQPLRKDFSPPLFLVTQFSRMPWRNWSAEQTPKPQCTDKTRVAVNLKYLLWKLTYLQYLSGAGEYDCPTQHQIKHEDSWIEKKKRLANLVYSSADCQ